VKLLEEPPEPLARRASLAARGFDRGQEKVVAAAHELTHYVLLGREVVEEGLLRDVSSRADVGHLGRLDALLSEQLGGRCDDAVGRLASPPVISGES
jgi:hypothetical protein